MIFQTQAELAIFSPVALNSWLLRASAGTPVSLLSHDACLIALAIMQDFLALPSIGNLPVEQMFKPGYATTKYVQDDGSEIQVPVVGALAAPTEEGARRWWDLLGACSWRIADLSVKNDGKLSAPEFAEQMAGAQSVLLIGDEHTESVITTQPLDSLIAENAPSAVAAGLIYKGAQAFVYGRAGRSAVMALTVGEQPAVTAAVDALWGEREKVKQRARMRAGIIGGLTIAAAVAAGRM